MLVFLSYLGRIVSCAMIMYYPIVVKLCISVRELLIKQPVLCYAFWLVYYIRLADVLFMSLGPLYELP